MLTKFFKYFMALLFTVLLLSPINANASTNKYYVYDLDYNKVIDIVDLSILSSNYNVTDSNSSYNRYHDFNSDKIIDIYDLVMLSKNLGNSVPTEPKIGYIYSHAGPLNVRSEPTLHPNSQILGKLNNGDRVEVVDTSNPDWYKINYNGSFAYINYLYVNFNKPVNLSEGTVSVVDSTYKVLALRTNPYVESKLIAMIPNGTKITIVNSDNPTWLKVVATGIDENSKPTEENMGYVHKLYVLRKGINDFTSSNNLIEFIKDYEQFSPIPYDDGTGTMTIGYGHVIKAGEHFTSLTKEEATELLKKDLKERETYLNYTFSSKNISNITQQQFDSLVSFVFNAGEENFEKSNILNIITSKDYSTEDLRIEMEKYIYDNNGVASLGLKRRRWDEWQMFVYGDYKRDYHYSKL